MPSHRSILAIILLGSFYLAVSVFIFRGVLFEPGTIGLRNDWSIAPLRIQYQARFEQALTNWSHDYLGIVLLRRTDILLTFILAFFSVVFGFGGAVFSKAIPIVAFTAAGLFAYLLVKTVISSRLGALLGSLVYMLSPLAFNVVVFGQHHLMIGYALYPLLLLLYLKAIMRGQVALWTIAAGLTLALAVSQDTFFTIGGISLLVVAAAHIFGHGHSGILMRIKRSTLSLAGIVLIAVLLHAPTFFTIASHMRAASENYQTVSFAWNTWNSPSILDAFSLDGAGIRSFYDTIKTPLKPYWIFVNAIVILVILSAVMLPTRRRLVLFLSACALFLLFLFKGVHSPLGSVNQWIFDNVPGMLIFRNLQYLTVFINLIFAILLAHVVDHWMGVYRITQDVQRRYWLLAIFSLFLVAFMLRLAPFSSGNFFRNVQVYRLGEEYEQVYTRFYKDPEDYRVLWLPPSQPMTYKATPHAGLDPFGSQSPKPSIIDNPVQPIEYFLHMVLYTQPATNLLELLRALAVRYVVYREDLVSRTPNFQWGEFPKDEWTNEQLQRSLNAQKSLQNTETYGNGAIQVYQLSQASSRISMERSVELSTGDLSDYVFLADLWSATGLTPSAKLYPFQVNRTLSPEFIENVTGRINIVNNNVFDLLSLFLDQRVQELRIVNIVRDARDGWSPQWWWKDWRYASLLDPVVFTTKAHNEIVDFSTDEVVDASIWVKSYKSAKGSYLHWELDGRNIGSIDTSEDVLQGLSWDGMFAGTVPAGKHQLKITSEEGENAIARILVVPRTAYEAAQSRVEELAQSREFLLSMNLDFRDSPTYTPVESKRTYSDTLFVNADIPFTVPVSGVYDIVTNAAGGTRLSQQQKEGDSYQTIEQGKTVGQTFTVDVTDTIIQKISISAEARELTTNTPASVIPDAPLIARLYKMEETDKTYVAESIVKPSAAGINDAWKLTDADFSVVIEWSGDTAPVYAVEYSTDATEIVWAVRTVKDGFRGRDDNYKGGQMIVNGSYHSADLAFVVMTHTDDAKLDKLLLDSTQLPLEKVSTPWQGRTTKELTKGIHLISVRGVRPQTSYIQLVLKRRGPNLNPSSVPIVYARNSDVRFSTETISYSSPYMFIFSESYDPGWQIEIQTEDGNKKLVPEDKHVKLNGYANGWWVDEQRPHSVTVRFAPQRYYTIGLYTMAITLFALAIIVFRSISRVVLSKDSHNSKQARSS